MNDQGGWGRSDSKGQGGGTSGGYGDGGDNTGGGQYGGNSGNSGRDSNGLTRNQVGYGYRAGSGDIAGTRYGQDTSSNQYSGWGGFGQMAGGLLTGNALGIAKGAAKNFGTGNMNDTGSSDTSRGDSVSNGLTLAGANAASSTPKTSTTASKSIYPSVYTDPLTGRLIYQSQSAGNTTNQGYSDQALLDQLMGTSVAGQNVTQDIQNLQSTIANAKANKQDTTYYEQELARLQGLSGSNTGTSSTTNPLLAYLDSGLNERVANEQLDMSNQNSLIASNELAAKRGLGVLGSPMQDQVRANLGLSTAQARNQNKATAQNDAYTKKMNLMSYLKNSQQQDYNQQMGRTAIPMTMADWENQRKIAEIAQNNQNSQFNQNLSYLKGQQSDANQNAWLNAAGSALGGVDWSSFF